MHAHTHTHTHTRVCTQTHTVPCSSLERRLEEAARETTHSCLMFGFVSAGGGSEAAEHLTTQSLTSIGSYCLCWTGPPADNSEFSKEGQEVKNPFSSASSFNLTVASKASYSCLFELLQTCSLTLFRPLVPSYNQDTGHMSADRVALFITGFSVHHCSCVRTQSSPTSIQVSSAIPRGFHYSFKMLFFYKDFTLPDKFLHCLRALEPPCPSAIGYKVAEWWGLSGCFIVTMFRRILFRQYSSH